MEGFYDAESLIVQRLEAKVNAKIYTAAELAELDERKQKTPAVHVINGGFGPTQARGDGVVQEIEHTWWLVVADKNATQSASGTGSKVRSQVGPLIKQTIEAMIGWRPNNEHRAFRMAESPQPAYSAGYGYFPLAFTTRTQHRGNP